MSVVDNLRRAGAGLLGATALAATVAVAPPAQAQAADRTITINVPVVSNIIPGPTRLVGLEMPMTLRNGAVMVAGNLWSNNLAGLTNLSGGISNALSAANLGLIADFGVSDRLQLQLQTGLGGAGLGAASVMGKYGIFQEAVGGMPLSLGVMARVSGSLPGLSQIMAMNFSAANLGVSVGLPVGKSLSDRLAVFAVPGLSVIGGPNGLLTTANLGLGADFAITDKFRALLDATIGTPSAGIVAVPTGTAFNAGLRYAFSNNFTSDLYLGVGGAGLGAGTLGLPVNIPSLGLSAAYRF